MRELKKRMRQADELHGMVRACVEGDETRWLYTRYLDDEEEPLAAYLRSFDELQTLLHGEDTVAKRYTRARFKFVEADYASKFYEQHIARHSEFAPLADWKNLLTQTIWLSRSQACYAGEVDKHMTMDDFLSLPGLQRRASKQSLSMFLSSERAGGRLVSCSMSDDLRLKWWAPSVRYVIDVWVQRLSWFCIRGVMLGRDKPDFQQVYRNDWVVGLNMPDEIYDFALAHSWGFGPEDSFLGDLPENVFPLQTRKSGGRT